MRAPIGHRSGVRWMDLETWLEGLEDQQRGRVLELARRLKPDLTLEDVRNPHDFPELGDPDWHYEDGTLTGIQSVLMAVRSFRRQHETDEDPSSQQDE